VAISQVDVSVAHRAFARVGEGPFWDAASHRLSWVDILAGAVTSVGADGRRTEVTLPCTVGAAIPKESGGYIAATATGFAEITERTTVVDRVSMLPAGQRMNDAGCDPAGRLWAGSTELRFKEGHGAVHVVDEKWRVRTVLTDLTLPNGLGWSTDGRTFYLIDSIAAEVNAFNVADDGFGLRDRRVLARLDGEGLPDGMTVDASGSLWIAMWGGNRLIRLSPGGDILRQVELPVAQPSSCAFGGPELDVLYVTTAREGLETTGEADGSILAVRGLNVRGRPGRRFAG